MRDLEPVLLAQLVRLCLPIIIYPIIGKHLDEPQRYILYIAYHRDPRLHVLADLGGVYIYVYELVSFLYPLCVRYASVAEPCSHCDNKIRLVYQAVSAL